MNPKLSVGFARVDITPTESVPLGGYGNDHTRMSQGVLDPLMATCVVFTDENDSTLVLYSLDQLLTLGTIWPAVVEYVAQTYGVSKNAVILASTHTHSAPSSSMNPMPCLVRYRQFLTEQLYKAADIAMEDRADTTIQIGHIQNEGLNFVRHYLMADGSVAGDNFGDYKNGTVLHSVTQPDRNIQLIKLLRKDKKDILMVNWQSHPALASTKTSEYGIAHRPYITSDYVGITRTVVEEKTGMYFAFFQGACGNISSRTYDPKESVTRNHVEYGKQLAVYVLKGLESLRSVPNGPVDAKGMNYVGEVDHSEDHLLPYAQKILECWQKENDYKLCVQMGKPYGINSPYHALSITNKVNMGKRLDMNLGAGRVGSIGFAFIPYEPFDTNGMQIKDASPFDMTFILGYANGYFNYVPSKLGFEYSCYEKNSCKHKPGTGEEVADAIIEVLKQLHEK